MRSRASWLVFHIAAAAAAAGAGAAERSLVWEDNFDGNSLDETVWTTKTGNGCDQGEGLCGWGNYEQQTYTEENHEVRDGLLRITAVREEVQVDERWYTSSRIKSTPPVAFLTGRIEASIKVPLGTGLWAAFWMLPANSSRGSWAATGEIDIMEAINDMDAILGTIHYGGEYPANRFAGCMSPRLGSGLDYSDDYHVYAIEWEQDEMRWYIDDQLFCQRTKWTSDLTSYAPFRAPFDTEFVLMFNLAVGGLLPGRVVDDSIFPATMLVDYVRVYNITTDVPEAHPFLGLPACLPGTIEAEAFDTGGPGLGFGGPQRVDESGTYRVDGLGLVYTALGITYVANLTEYDWLAYTVRTDEAVYDVTLQISTAAAADLQLVIGADATCANPGDGSITDVFGAAATGDLTRGSWGTTVVSGVAMSAGTHSLKLCVGGGVGVNIDSIRFDLSGGTKASGLTSAECTNSGESRPYMYGEPWVIPGYMEAEYYDYGGLGVSYHKNMPSTFMGDSTLRLPDAVAVIEAESNPLNGQYVGFWNPGEWLAFTARADEAGFWYAGASVASGLNGTSVEFRILVNATNCSSPATDGWDGLGDAGVDLLDGPMMGGFTGSWEAFEIIYKEDVYVPEGTHRFLFCVDDGLFNLNFLRVWTPEPTRAPTMAPTIAPTPAPQIPGDDGGSDTRWIYIGIAGGVVLLALARLGFIIYTKERARSSKSDSNGLEPGFAGFKGAAAPMDESEDGSTRGGTQTPPSDEAFGAAEGGELSTQGRGRLSDGGGPDIWRAAVGGGRIVAPADGANPGSPTGPQGNYRELFGSKREIATSRGLSGSFQDVSPTAPATGSHAVSQGQEQALQQRTGASFGPGESGSDVEGVVLSSAASSRLLSIRGRALLQTPSSRGGSRPSSGRYSQPVSRSNSLSAPVAKSVGSARSHNSNAPRIPRVRSGLEPTPSSRSLWDPSTVSPITSQRGGAKPSSPRASSPLHESSCSAQDRDSRRSSRGRDQFEDALLRALEDKWEAKSAQRNGDGAASTEQPPIIARSHSYGDGTPFMLNAVKTWTCVCSFENSVGQTSCLRCGRVAPLSKPSTPARRRLPPHRMNSNIAPPSEGDL